MISTASEILKQQLKIQITKQPSKSRLQLPIMKDKKQIQTEMSSLSTLGPSHEHSQATKKTISTEQISMQSSHSHLQRLSSHHNIILPFQINIKSLIKHLLMKLQEQGIIILYSDENEGQILIQKRVHKNCLTNFLDCLCLCKKQGWPRGSITQSFQAVSIHIKRQYIQYRCRIKIRTNCPRDKSSPQLLQFVQQTIQFTKKCLQPFKDTNEEQKIMDINQQSPMAMEITANQKAYQLFMSNDIEDKRFKTLFNTSLQKIKHQMQIFKKQNNIAQKTQKIEQIKKQQSIQQKPKNVKNNKKKIRISQSMQLLINQANNIFQFCRQLNIIKAPHFHPDYALYAIQGLFCYNLFSQLFQLYKHDMVRHCEEFYKNSQYINKNLSSKQYFDYLEVRPKYRLQSSQQPYDLAINALRELQTSLTLRQILLCMQKTFSLIKVCCLYEHDGKLDLTSMDDILPVMIYVVAKAQVIDFPVYVKIIDDYVKIKGVFQLEQRVITTLYVATEDISKKLPKINKQ